MSRQNKVNPDHYKVAGRLSPDDLARERRLQQSATTADLRDTRRGRPQPPWMAEGQPAAARPSASEVAPEKPQKPQKAEKQENRGKRETKAARAATPPRRRKADAAAEAARTRRGKEW